ncbi:aquaporin 1 [Rhizophagus irregularis]|uniref:Aquaporin 1 n=3 Tax=Rhizophagus irregularis TaxID=588596 RepID=A0A2I1EI81_9GLOM|nr:aquaporin 1 [Rhizophagus irregularis DAOM 181602=DAOM 197198]EXX77181.1 Aqy1p [Rhizophagus irregularis DAOM 197198w]PKC10988.1 aquaporin 1 [Rhizophagus irregularis]PKK73774.1 aquaporin 1 [Rhizophagus irregularis]PKY21835.1 aquaporin 1 [Rhizophagus irregularis]POG63848.1 aquaporin 1 [Rhizophagus irregularis DAOM 181602=DAOM 197198]|eukprot:XP_025170714.1 aquaporin 1 [Rhizophagus irregularis DAOM 181602=DAOM 197198]
MGLKDDFVTSLAEFIGTTYFIFIGLGGSDAIAAFSGKSLGDIKLFATAFSFGWSLMINVWLWSDISGGVLNPAITIALMFTDDQELRIRRGIFYIIAQFAGAILGSLLVKLFLPAPIAALTTLSDGTTILQGLVIEIITTSLLTLTVYTLAVNERGGFMKSFGIGTSVLISVLVAGPYTGASLNPARTLGPAIVAGKISGDIWIYFIGPIIGSLLAASFHTYFKKNFGALHLDRDRDDLDRDLDLDRENLGKD